MPFARPTFSDILTRVQADINSRLPGSDARLRRSVLNVLSYVIAGVAHGLYGFQIWISKQAFPDTADGDNLARWGSIWGVTRLQATSATGHTVATGSNGSVIPNGTQLSRSDGVLFATTADETISGGTATLPVSAIVAAEASNTAGSSILSFVSPPSGVDTTTTIDSNGLTGGSDIETDSNYLVRILERIQQPPSGGADFDYVAWAMATPGVTRAWVYDGELGIGNVSVRFMMDNTYSNGIPLSGDVATVQAYINARRPVTAIATVVAPVPVTQNFTIHLNINDTAEIRAAVTAELKDMILRDGSPACTLYLSRINEAIQDATGTYDHTLTSPGANVVFTTGQIPVMGTITWT